MSVWFVQCRCSASSAALCDSSANAANTASDRPQCKALRDRSLSRGRSPVLHTPTRDQSDPKQATRLVRRPSRQALAPPCACAAAAMRMACMHQGLAHSFKRSAILTAAAVLPHKQRIAREASQQPLPAAGHQSQAQEPRARSGACACRQEERMAGLCQHKEAANTMCDAVKASYTPTWGARLSGFPLIPSAPRCPMPGPRLVPLRQRLGPVWGSLLGAAGITGCSSSAMLLLSLQCICCRCTCGWCLHCCVSARAVLCAQGKGSLPHLALLPRTAAARLSMACRCTLLRIAAQPPGRGPRRQRRGKWVLRPRWGGLSWTESMNRTVRGRPAATAASCLAAAAARWGPQNCPG